jgi:hypothetical protein
MRGLIAQNKLVGVARHVLWYLSYQITGEAKTRSR